MAFGPRGASRLNPRSLGRIARASLALNGDNRGFSTRLCVQMGVSGLWARFLPIADALDLTPRGASAHSHAAFQRPKSSSTDGQAPRLRGESLTSNSGDSRGEWRSSNDCTSGPPSGRQLRRSAEMANWPGFTARVAKHSRPQSVGKTQQAGNVREYLPDSRFGSNQIAAQKAAISLDGPDSPVKKRVSMRVVEEQGKLSLTESLTFGLCGGRIL